MAEHGVFRMPGKELALEPAARLEQLNSEPGYRIFTECIRSGVRGYRKKLVPGTKIRVDLFNGLPLWKVKELHRCRNWKVDCKCRKYGCITYYIDILSG